ncbi:MAG: polysaccharide deacetylase family protein [Bryobacterales bacterium]|nr:polysaccharide deacetylase family protein [Bryobacterales bacterium]
MLGEVLGGAAVAAAGVLAWGVRGKSSTLLGPSYWRGPSHRRALALTFDDGPSKQTPELLSLLARHAAKATFFQCGQAVRRLPEIARQVRAAGHEIGNHTETHAALYLRSSGFIFSELEYAQRTIEETAGVRPRLFRPPYGARWFGLRAAQERLGLTCVMWTVIARDWVLGAEGIVERLKSPDPGAILCLHDGRETAPNPDITPTINAVGKLLPAWKADGFEFLTVSELLSLPATHAA